MIRLKSLMLGAAVMGAALSLPTPAHATLSDVKTKMVHMFKGNGSKKKATEAASEKPATPPAAEHKHTNGFPEPDKLGPQYQPQSEPQWWGDKAWKTNSNKDTWKGQ
jgi:hypothetical protein